MLRKTAFNLTILITLTAVLGGCSSENHPAVNANQKKSTLTVKAQSKDTTVQSQVNASDTTVKKADTTGNTAIDTTNEKPVVPEKNPPGDIPDSQVFIKYSSPIGGYELQVPEGWARTESGTDVKFVDKFDGLHVKILTAADPLTADSIQKQQVANLVKEGRAVNVKSVKEVKLSGMNAFVISYDSNSDPDPVTNKQIRLENENYYFYKNGKVAVVTVWAPLGADNVDQWNFMSNKFKWR